MEVEVVDDFKEGILDGISLLSAHDGGLCAISIPLATAPEPRPSGLWWRGSHSRPC